MKRFLIVLFLISFLIPNEIGRYKLTVSSLLSSKGKVYVVETVLDTKTGKIVGRNKILLSKYNKKIQKTNYMELNMRCDYGHYYPEEFSKNCIYCKELKKQPETKND